MRLFCLAVLLGFVGCVVGVAPAVFHRGCIYVDQQPYFAVVINTCGAQGGTNEIKFPYSVESQTSWKIASLPAWDGTARYPLPTNAIQIEVA